MLFISILYFTESFHYQGRGKVKNLFRAEYPFIVIISVLKPAMMIYG